MTAAVHDDAEHTSNVVAIRRPEQTGALALSSSQTEWSPAQRAALVQLGLEGAPDADLMVFLHQAQRTGLDPFARQIYMIARWDGRTKKNKYTIQTGIDGFRIVADRRPEYGGQVGPEWCGQDGVWRDVWVSNTPPVAARVGVIRKGWERPIYATALFREYAGFDNKGDLTRMWREKGALMIAKCAEALALRKAFPQDLSGIYTSEEMTQADGNPPPVIIDQPPAPAADVDWDAEIERLAGDTDGLRELWHKAPAGSEIRKRIAAAAKEQQPAEEDPDGVVDAEIVEEPAKPTKADLAQEAARISDDLMGCDLPEQVARIHAQQIDGQPVESVDVSGLLTQDDRDILGIEPGRITLAELAGRLHGYTERHRQSPRGFEDEAVES